MTRRGFLALPAVAATPRESPHDAVANRGNEFHDTHVAWADAFNHTPQGGVSVTAVELFSELGLRFRRLEHAWKDYIRR